MKINKYILIVFVIVLLAYILYFVVGMSSTFTTLKEYNFKINKEDFDKKLAARIYNSDAWSFEKTDSIKGEGGKACYWASLSYEGNEQDLLYIIKYCYDSKTLNDGDGCVDLYIVGAIDYVNKSGGYKTSDNDVEKLLKILDRALFDDLAPECFK